MKGGGGAEGECERKRAGQIVKIIGTRPGLVFLSEFVLSKAHRYKCLVAALKRVEMIMEMARRSAALLCVLLYHAAPALAFVAPGALAPCRPALQVPLRSRDTPGAVPQACEFMKEGGTAGACEALSRHAANTERAGCSIL